MKEIKEIVEKLQEKKLQKMQALDKKIEKHFSSIEEAEKLRDTYYFLNSKFNYNIKIGVSVAIFIPEFTLNTNKILITNEYFHSGCDTCGYGSSATVKALINNKYLLLINKSSSEEEAGLLAVSVELNNLLSKYKIEEISNMFSIYKKIKDNIINLSTSNNDINYYRKEEQLRINKSYDYALFLLKHVKYSGVVKSENFIYSLSKEEKELLNKTTLFCALEEEFKKTYTYVDDKYNMIYDIFYNDYIDYIKSLPVFVPKNSRLKKDKILDTLIIGKQKSKYVLQFYRAKHVHTTVYIDNTKYKQKKDFNLVEYDLLDLKILGLIDFIHPDKDEIKKKCSLVFCGDTIEELNNNITNYYN